VKEVQTEVQKEEESMYIINLFRIGTTEDFKVQLLINNHLDTVLADTRADISVCGLDMAKKWNLLEGMCKTNAKIRPYKSVPISAIGVGTCGVSFGDRTVPVQWHIIEESCEPILSGKKASHLEIVKYNQSPKILMPVNMIKLADKKLKERLQELKGGFKYSNCPKV